jgi:hypothetical protein
MSVNARLQQLTQKHSTLDFLARRGRTNPTSKEVSSLKRYGQTIGEAKEILS